MPFYRYIFIALSTTFSLWAEPPRSLSENDDRTSIYLVPNVHAIHNQLVESNLKNPSLHLKKIVEEIKPDILCVELNPTEVKRWQAGRKKLRYHRPEYTRGYMRWQKRFGYLVYPSVPKKEAFPTKVTKQSGYLTPDRIKARYAMIEKALNTHQGDGKKIIISHGSGWFDAFIPLIQARKNVAVINLTERIEHEAKEILKSRTLKKR